MTVANNNDCKSGEPDSIHPKRLESRILRAIHRANREYNLITPGDKILLALSGGKDSYAMAWAIQKMQRAAPFDLNLVLYHLDQGQPGHNVAPIESFMKATGLPYEVEYQDTYTRVVELTEEGKIYCSLCSRFRRAILYKAATRHGCNKVAVGHHADDLIETLLLNVLYAGQIKAMPPKLRSQTGTHQLIRPLCYVPESELIALSTLHEFPTVPCNLCGSQQAQRFFVKGLISDLSKRSPHIRGNILNSLQNVVPSHLMDTKLAPFLSSDPTQKLALDDESEGCGDLSPQAHTSLNVLN
jgi:tRNA 2-thiocytidine biosynthesis protein TtcA